MDSIDTAELEMIFGVDSYGSTPDERARSSSRIFVRSQDHLSLDTPILTGRRLSAWEALQAFGLDVLREVLEYSSAILPSNAKEPATTLKNRRESLDLSIEDLAKITGLEPAMIEDAENHKTRTPIRVIESIAQTLALDEHVISFVPQARGDGDLAIRLKELGKVRVSPNLVSRMCEAAWVIMKQHELNQWLEPAHISPIANIEPSSHYGDRDFPSWQRGYWLAHDTRELLQIPADAPIENLHELIEKLRIPVIQQKLLPTVAGATIANCSVRGITVNTTGHNENVWIRRVTLAHELGHLLWDPDENLMNLQVDDYETLEGDPQVQRDHVEARANAFAVEFLAPQQAAIKVFESDSDQRKGLRRVMKEFGLSFTSARFHIWNGLGRSIKLEDLTDVNPEPTDDWKGRESFTLDFFEPKSVPDSRRGLFASLVVRAVDKKLLGEESAAMYLGCSLDEYHSGIDIIRQIYD